MAAARPGREPRATPRSAGRRRPGARGCRAEIVVVRVGRQCAREGSARRAASRRASGGWAPDAAARTGEVARGSPTRSGRRAAGRSEGGPSASPGRPSNTSLSRDGNIRRAFAHRGRRGDATRRARHAPAGRRAEHRARSPTRRSLRARPRASLECGESPGPGASRACHRPADTISDRCARGRSDPQTDPRRSSRQSCPVPSATWDYPRPGGATRRRARTRTHGMSLDAEPPPLDDASRRARAPSRRARPPRPVASGARTRGPIDRPPRRDRDRDSVCGSSPASTAADADAPGVHSRHCRRTLPAVTREAVLDSCYGTTFWMLAIGVTAREAAARDALRPPSPTGRPLVAGLHPPRTEDIAFTSPSPSPPPPPSPPHAPRFSARGPISRSGGSTNRQVLTPLNRGDVVGQFPPGRRGGGAFRGALCPRSGADSWASRRRGRRSGRCVGGAGAPGLAGWAAGWGVSTARQAADRTPRWPCWRTDCCSAAMWLEGMGSRAWCDVAR